MVAFTRSRGKKQGKKQSKFTQQKRKTLSGSYVIIGNKTPKKVKIGEKNVDKTLYKKLEKQTLEYKKKLQKGEQIYTILRNCPEILKEALSSSDAHAYDLYRRYKHLTSNCGKRRKQREGLNSLLQIRSKGLTSRGLVIYVK